MYAGDPKNENFQISDLTESLASGPETGLQSPSSPQIEPNKQNKSQLHVEDIIRHRYPSSNNGEGGHDVDSSTELWDEEEDPLHCSSCSTALHNQYTGTLKLKIREQQKTLTQLKKTVNSFEAVKIKELELVQQLHQKEALTQEQKYEINRLEKLVEDLDQVAQDSEDLQLLLRLKDEEIQMLSKDLSRISERVSDYNEVEAHNTDLQSELFARDREVMSLKHSEERLRGTYLELVKKNTHLEENLLEQDRKHEEEKKKFENSIVQLTNKLITQRKKCEDSEQANARSVRDCRLAVRLLQCSNPGSNEHAVKLHQSNKLSFLFGEANNRPISSNDSKKLLKDLKQLRRGSFEEKSPQPTTQKPTSPVRTPSPVTIQTSQKNISPQPSENGQTNANKFKKNPSTGCLERLQWNYKFRDSALVPYTHLQGSLCGEFTEQDSVSVLKDLLQGKKDAIHVLRVELGKRDKEILLLRKKLTNNLSESINSKNMGPSERIENLESRVCFLNDENFNLKYQLEICRKMLDKLSGVAPAPQIQ